MWCVMGKGERLEGQGGGKALAESRQFHLRNGSIPGEPRQDGGARSHKAGCRPAPIRLSCNTYIHSVSEIRFEDET